MSKRSRDKGNRGENEFLDQLRGELGDWVPARRLDAPRDGGEDVEVSPFCIEIKRRETLSLQTWWEQACQQAVDKELLPALAYRQNRQPWRVMIPMDAENWLYAYTLTCASVAGFSQVVRESRPLPVGEYMAVAEYRYAIH